jgi:hypothetical protein
MLPVYGGKCLSHKVVHNWIEKFSQGHLKVAGCPAVTVMEATVQRGWKS